MFQSFADMLITDAKKHGIGNVLVDLAQYDPEDSLAAEVSTVYIPIRKQT